MVNPPNLTPEQLKENARKLKEQSLLETLEYQSLIDELEQSLIINKEPYLIKTYKELKKYPQLLFYLGLTGMLKNEKQSHYYFHIEGVDVAPNSKHPKKTAEDNMHKNIQLTLIYI